MQENLQKLLHLQELDKKGFETKNRLTQLPSEIKLLESRLTEANKAFDEAKKAFQILEVRRKELAVTIRESEERQIKLKTQETQVKKTEELHAIAHAVEAERSKMATAEDEELELLLKIDTEKKILETLEANHKAQALDITNQINTLKTQESTTQSSLIQLENDFKAYEPQIDSKTLQLYKRILNIRKKPPCVVPLDTEEHRCLGCHLKVSNDVYIALMKKEELVQCGQCNRILYIPSEQ